MQENVPLSSNINSSFVIRYVLCCASANQNYTSPTAFGTDSIRKSAQVRWVLPKMEHARSGYYLPVVGSSHVLLTNSQSKLRQCERMKRQSYHFNRQWRPIGLWDVEARTFSRQPAHWWRWGLKRLPPFMPISVRKWEILQRDKVVQFVKNGQTSSIK
jgi:hypothetical protein